MCPGVVSFLLRMRPKIQMVRAHLELGLLVNYMTLYNRFSYYLIVFSCVFTESAEMKPKPAALLSQQKYFHGSISRIEAEAKLDKDGQFLVRESSRQPGQYVLTGMVDGRPCHLLLTDEKGKVSACEHYALLNFV